MHTGKIRNGNIRLGNTRTRNPNADHIHADHIHTDDAHTRSYAPDAQHTTRHHAGESVADTRNRPGLLLFAVGLFALAGTLTAAGYGFAGRAVAGAVVTVVCLGGGAAIVTAEHRRVKIREGRRLIDRQGH